MNSKHGYEKRPSRPRERHEGEAEINVHVGGAGEAKAGGQQNPPKGFTNTEVLLLNLMISMY